MRINSVLALSLASFLCFSTCTKKEINNIYIIDKEKKGSIYGFVRLVEESNLRHPSDSGVMVSVVGSSTIAQVRTDNSGRYQVDSIPSGTYRILYTKKRWGDQFRQLVLNVPGGNQPILFPFATDVNQGIVYMVEECATKPSNPVVRDYFPVDTNTSRDSLFSISCDITPIVAQGQGWRQVSIFFDTVPGISTRTKESMGISNIRSGKAKYLAMATMRERFINGKTYYARIYGDPIYASILFDPVTGQSITNNYNSEPTEEFTFTPRW